MGRERNHGMQQAPAPARGGPCSLHSAPTGSMAVTPLSWRAMTSATSATKHPVSGALFLAAALTAFTGTTPPFSLPHHLPVRIPFIGIQYTIAVAVRCGKHRFMPLPELFFGHITVTVQVPYDPCRSVPGPA